MYAYKHTYTHARIHTRIHTRIQTITLHTYIDIYRPHSSPPFCSISSCLSPRTYPPTQTATLKPTAREWCGEDGVWCQPSKRAPCSHRRAAKLPAQSARPSGSAKHGARQTRGTDIARLQSPARGRVVSVALQHGPISAQLGVFAARAGTRPTPGGEDDRNPKGRVLHGRLHDEGCREHHHHRQSKTNHA